MDKFRFLLIDSLENCKKKLSLRDFKNNDENH